MIDTVSSAAADTSGEPSAWDRLKRDRNWLGFWFMLPAMAFLLLFLAYPLVLGIYMSFTDSTLR